MKVYGHPLSTCTRKVLTTFAEKGYEAQFVLVDVLKNEHKSPEYMGRHHFGVIPALEDGGFFMYESRAIIRYLDAKLSGTPLTPSELQARGRMEQWISVEHSYFSPAAKIIIAEKIIKPLRGGTTDMERVVKAKEETGKVLDIVDRVLSSQAYFAGEQFSLAEIAWMPYIGALFKAQEGELIESRPNVMAWWERISSRPSWKKVTG